MQLTCFAKVFDTRRLNRFLSVATLLLRAGALAVAQSLSTVYNFAGGTISDLSGNYYQHCSAAGEKCVSGSQAADHGTR